MAAPEALHFCQSEELTLLKNPTRKKVLEKKWLAGWAVNSRELRDRKVPADSRAGSFICTVGSKLELSVLQIR